MCVFSKFEVDKVLLTFISTCKYGGEGSFPTLCCNSAQLLQLTKCNILKAGSLEKVAVAKRAIALMIKN